MSDPLSVAGTAVGITSLGIQICQGLVSYLRSVKGRKQDIADGLNEVKTLISLFHALQNLVPKIDQKCVDSTAIRRCLSNSEEKLAEFQKQLNGLRGPNPSASNTWSKMREAGRSIIYPFYEEKLISLRQSLGDLLHNLNLAVGIANLDTDIAQTHKIDTIGSAIQGLETETKVQDGRMQMLNTQMQENLKQIHLAEQSVTDCLKEIQERLVRVEWDIQDLGQNVSGRLTMIESNTQSVVSNSSITVEMLTTLTDKMDAQSTLVEKLVWPCPSSIVPDYVPLNASIKGLGISRSESHGTHRLSSRNNLQYYDNDEEQLLSGPSVNLSAMPFNPRRAASTVPKARRPRCSCTRPTQSYKFSFSFWHVNFQFEQHVPGKHNRGCKFYGIDDSVERSIKAQLPLKVAWFSNRITLACIEHMMGTSSPGISVRYKNVVPWSHCPIMKAWQELFPFTSRNGGQLGPSKQLAPNLQRFERTVLSLYRDGKSSPHDLDEYGDNHIWLINSYIGYSRLLRDRSDVATIISLFQTLMQIVPVDDRTLLELFAYFAQTFDVEWSPGIRFLIEFDGISSLTSLPNLTNGRAILSKSLDDLEECIQRSPGAPTETIAGHTTIQLCATWPAGLRRLLMTNARRFADDWDEAETTSPLEISIMNNCNGSVDMLLEAGCRIPRRLYHDWSSSPQEWITIIASKLAQRRRRLLELAQRELGILQDLDPSDNADNRAAYICNALDQSGIHVPQDLRVEWDYETVYHSHKVPLHHFLLFFENGFRHCNSHNFVGLTPVMYSGLIYGSKDVVDTSTLMWAQRQGLLDQTAQDPLNLGLNTYATGWHYAAARVGEMSVTSGLGLTHAHVQKQRALTQQLICVPARDHCVCWCSPAGSGCSPLQSLFNAHTNACEQDVYFPHEEMARRHYLFHHNMDSNLAEGSPIVNAFAEVVRLLTFEALDMTHTCCGLREIRRHVPPCDHHQNGEDDEEEQHYYSELVLKNLPREGPTIGSESSGQLGAHQLDVLMEEFALQLGTLDSSPKALEGFIWGYWRKRMSELFVVDPKVLSDMEQTLDSVQTYVLPQRVECILGHNFDWIRPRHSQEPNSKGMDINDCASQVEEVGATPYCLYCDGDETED
ncbi:hypothetical protein FZEAL_1822 [Fusarium zealandicum]|uniref:Fungal N-terminal domain-containing protein n=1 Tax=Fusarium zealandicum TaxID=1053134 RepID=A0A8H4US08_9HYPO|nr:hypothetical protein FZEAL_1822 [Fusarium zealandicum]